MMGLRGGGCAPPCRWRGEERCRIPDLTYAAQFEVLSVWIGSLQPGELASPSVLPGWTVADLISHLAGTGTTIAALRAD